MLPSTAAERKLSRLRCGPGPVAVAGLVAPWPWPWPILGVSERSASQSRPSFPQLRPAPGLRLAAQPRPHTIRDVRRFLSFERRTPSFCPCKQAVASSQGHTKYSGSPQVIRELSLCLTGLFHIIGEK